MAIQKNVTAVDMKTVLNYGEQSDGKIMKKTKTYGDIKTDVTDEAFMSTSKAIAAMQEPIMEKREKIVAEELTETV